MAMHILFADWYRTVDIEPNAATLPLHWRAVEALAAESNANKLLGIVSLFAGAPGPGSEEAAINLAQSLKSEDATFPMVNNRALIRIIAGSVIANVLEKRGVKADVASMALLCGNASDKGHRGPISDLFPIAQAYLAQEARLERSSLESSSTTVEEPDDPMEDLADLDIASTMNSGGWVVAVSRLNEREQELREGIGALYGDVLSIIRRLNRGQAPFASLVTRLKVLEEESNVLWWLFGEYSRDMDRHLSSLATPFRAIVVGKEVADLTQIRVGLLSARAIIERAVRIGGAGEDAIPLSYAIDSVPFEWRRQWSSVDSVTLPSALVPVHSAMAASVRAGEGSSYTNWGHAFMSATGLDDFSLHPVDLAHQVYREALLVRLAKSSSAVPTT